MTQADNSTEEVTTIESESPQQIIKKTTTQTEPQARGETPQKVYEKKKTIFRFNQVIWFILGVIEVLLAFRVVLKALGANPQTGFTSLINSLTTPLAEPFRGILNVSITGSSLIEWSTIIAAIVYLCVAWGFVYFMNLVYPISPRDV